MPNYASIAALASDLSDEAPFTGAFAAPDEIAPAATGTAATDTAALQAAIDATPEGGLLWIPTGTYKTNAALTVTKHITIHGQAMSENFDSKTDGGAIGSPVSPYFKGVVIEQQTAATDVLALTGSGITAHLRNLGLTFASAIRGTDTGHGVNATPTQTYSSGHDAGVTAFLWENVGVYGHDGDHYAFVLLNPILGTVRQLRSYGGGLISIECDSYAGNYGNLVLDHIFGELNAAGTADGVHLASRTTAASTGVLNLLTFIRPQVNVVGAAATAGTQKAWNANGGAELPSYVGVLDPNIEIASGSSCTIDFGGVNSGHTVLGAGLLTKAPAGGYTRALGYQRFTTNGSFTVPNGTTAVRVRCVAGGGGGGGGGSASAATNQAGGGGGGAGGITDVTITTDDGLAYGGTYAITVGAGGTSGAGAAAGGNPGSNGGTGGTSSFGGTVSANGGGGGVGGTANSNASKGGGLMAHSSSSTTVGLPGAGGVSQSPNGNAAFTCPPGITGGGAGGGANATLGGGGGSAHTTGWFRAMGIAGGSGAASATANGIDGTTATTPGCGGGGGGAGAPSGAGGAGGVGGPGLVEVWWW